MEHIGKAIAKTAEAIKNTALGHKRSAAFHKARMHDCYRELDELRDTAKSLGLELVLTKKGGGKDHGQTTPRSIHRD